jgi:SMODS-associated and fused to various effectors sensor domain
MPGTSTTSCCTETIRPTHTSRSSTTVDSRTPVNTAYPSDPSSTGGPSILKKIASTWQTLTRSREPVELAVVTNRLTDPGDPLLAGRDARTRLLVPRAVAGGPQSILGKARAQWASAIGLSETELLELLGVLEFDLGHDSLHLARTVGLTMAVAGLRCDEASLDAGIDWVSQQVIAGRRELTLADIRDAIEARELRIEDERAIVSVATLVPDPLAGHALHTIDWVDRFGGQNANLKRRPKAPATWAELQADIEAIPAHLGSARRVVITGSLRLAPAFAVGAAMRMVTGIDVAAMQRGELWRSEAPYTAPVTPVAYEYAIDQGDDLAIAIEVATPIADDLIRWIRDRALPVRRLVVLGASGGPRDNAVAGAEDACALAVGIRNAVRQEVRDHPRVHLFLAGPMGLALLLGHRWNRIAPTVVYEDLAALGYEAAFSISA